MGQDCHIENWFRFHPVHRIDYLEEKIAAQVSNVFIFFTGQESVHLGSSNADHSHQCTIN